MEEQQQYEEKNLDQDAIYKYIKSLFYEDGVDIIENWVSEPLKDLIRVLSTADGRKMFLKSEISSKIVYRYFSENDFKSDNKETKQRLMKRRVKLFQIFKATMLYFATRDPDYIARNNIKFIDNPEELFKEHEWLANSKMSEMPYQDRRLVLNPMSDSQEISYLITFVNNLRVAMSFIPAKDNKQLLLDILARLENSKEKYTTGGAPRPPTARRMKLIEIEGNEGPIIRPNRKKTLDDEKKRLNTAEKKRKLNVFTNEQDVVGKQEMIEGNPIYLPEQTKALIFHNGTGGTMAGPLHYQLEPFNTGKNGSIYVLTIT
jgi:hypothetical protein